MAKQIEKIKEYLILAIIVLYPIAFAGSFIDNTGLPKLIILVSLLALVLITIAAQIYFTGKLGFAKGRFDLPVILLILAYLISGILITPNKNESFFLPGTATTIIGAGLLYFLLNSIEDKSKIKLALITSSLILSLITIASFSGIFDKISFLPPFMKASSFNPTGDYLSATIYLLATTPFAIFLLVKENDLIKKLVLAFSTVFILIAAGISIFTLVSPDKKNAPLLPPFQTSWVVAIDTIRENPLLGMGPGNYLSAFGKFRPQSYNQTNLWQIRFSTGRDWYLTLATETGIVGLIAIGILLVTVIRTLNKEHLTISLSILLGVLVILAVFPGTPATLLLLFVILAINSQSKQSEISLGSNSTIYLLVSIALVAAVLFFAFKAKPVVLAENKFKNANIALSQDDGKKTYDLLKDSINLNPYEDRYHASFAQVSLAIARSIAANAKDAKDLTDDQKNTILQLLQQAIKEGQNTVALNPTRAANWQVLGNIYQTIIPFANQADQFSIQSYSQAVNLDPLDPTLRISLGGIYYSLNQYDNAINNFQFAVYAKPDYANAYYNLSAAYAAKNDFDNAVSAMNTVISLVQKDSNDYKQAQTDLDNLKKKQQAFKETNGSSSLTAPKKETQAVTPKLELPSEASPPAVPAPSPTPIPSATGAK